MGRMTEAVKHLIIINVIFYLVTYFVPNMQDKMLEWFALFYPKSEYFRPWQFVTHMFMHGNFMHILFNMYGLWAFGSPLEQMWGRNKFFFFYFSAGIGAALIYTLANYYFRAGNSSMTVHLIKIILNIIVRTLVILLILNNLHKILRPTSKGTSG